MWGGTARPWGQRCISKLPHLPRKSKPGPRAGYAAGRRRATAWAWLTPRSSPMRFVQIEMLPTGMALVDLDKLTHAVPQG